MNKIDKIMIVSHPDDEALFGGAELLRHPDEYKVVVLDEYHNDIRRREFLWSEASNFIDFNLLSQSVKEINLEDLLDVFPKMLKGGTSGRYIVDLKK